MPARSSGPVFWGPNFWGPNFWAPNFWGELMRREFQASVSREGDWFVAQCLEVDVASQGSTEEQALANLEQALALHFEPPRAGL